MGIWRLARGRPGRLQSLKQRGPTLEFYRPGLGRHRVCRARLVVHVFCRIASLVVLVLRAEKWTRPLALQSSCISGTKMVAATVDSDSMTVPGPVTRCASIPCAPRGCGRRWLRRRRSPVLPRLYFFSCEFVPRRLIKCERQPREVIASLQLDLPERLEEPVALGSRPERCTY
jgi:hypothetical protein